LDLNVGAVLPAEELIGQLPKVREGVRGFLPFILYHKQPAVPRTRMTSS
jgi:hypothetical protein